MRSLGIELISVFSLPPVEFVHLAADLGCNGISFGLGSMGYNPHGYPPFSTDDPVLRRAMVDAMRERGVSISLGEGFVVRPDADAREYARQFDIMGELGVTLINMVSMDPDLSRTFDQYGTLVEMAAATGMESTTEFAPALTVADLPTALDAVRHVGREDFRLLIDTMHFFRSGSTLADIEAVDPAQIGYIQLCDAPLAPRYSTYMEEAMFERMVPGTGELPLRDLLAALPHHLHIGLEVPLRSQAEAGVGPHDRLRPVVEAAREMLADIDG